MSVENAWRLEVPAARGQRIHGPDVDTQTVAELELQADIACDGEEKPVWVLEAAVKIGGLKVLC